MKTSLLLLAYGLQINQNHKEPNNGMDTPRADLLFIEISTYLFIYQIHFYY